MHQCVHGVLPVFACTVCESRPSGLLCATRTTFCRCLVPLRVWRWRRLTKRSARALAMCAIWAFLHALLWSTLCLQHVFIAGYPSVPTVPCRPCIAFAFGPCQTVDVLCGAIQAACFVYIVVVIFVALFFHPPLPSQPKSIPCRDARTTSSVVARYCDRHSSPMRRCTTLFFRPSSREQLSMRLLLFGWNARSYRMCVTYKDFFFGSVLFPM